jgi:hypothetical protein
MIGRSSGIDPRFTSQAVSLIIGRSVIARKDPLPQPLPIFVLTVGVSAVTPPTGPGNICVYSLTIVCNLRRVVRNLFKTGPEALDNYVYMLLIPMPVCPGRPK